MRDDRIARFERAATFIVSAGAAVALYGFCRHPWSAIPLSALDVAQQSAALAWQVPRLAIAVLIAYRSKNHRANNTLALALALVSANDAVASLAHVGPDSWHTPLYAVLCITYWCAASFGIIAAQTFPARLRPVDLDVFAERMPRLAFLRGPLVLLLRPYAPWIFTLVVFALNYTSRGMNALFDVLILFVVGSYWFVQWRIGSLRRRRKVAWLLQTVLTFIIFLGIVTPVFGLLSLAGAKAVLPYLTIVTNFALGVAVSIFLGMGVFRAGAIHPDLVLRRTLVYGVAAWLLLFALQVALSVGVDSLKDALGISDRIIAAIFGTLAGLLFAPLSARIKALVNRITQPDPPHALRA